MSEQWLGLRNHERHTGEFLDPGVADCECCECRYCADDSPCRCCLAAEVETLRGTLRGYETAAYVLAAEVDDLRTQLIAALALLTSRTTAAALDGA
jgi:hypothetical protein